MDAWDDWARSLVLGRSLVAAGHDVSDQPRWPKGSPFGGQFGGGAGLIRLDHEDRRAREMSRVDAHREYDERHQGRGWGITEEFPHTLPDGHPLLTHTNLIDSPERDQLRQGIVDKVIGDTKPVEGRPPVVTFFGGGGGSGKSTLMKDMVREGELNDENVVKINPDDVKHEIPEYKKIIDAGDSRAARTVHTESSEISEAIQQRAIDEKLDVINDVTLGNPDGPWGGIAALEKFKAAGYDINLVGVTADPTSAVKRNIARAAREGRYVPLDKQLEAHKGFSAAFERYAELADSVELYNTDTEGRPVLVAKKVKGGQLVVLEDFLWDDFQGKADLNPRAPSPDQLY